MLHDIPEFTVPEHHECCIGILALCYHHVPKELQDAIMQGLQSAKKMGMNIKPENVLTKEPLHAVIRAFGA